MVNLPLSKLDFENPLDANGDNIYNLTLSVNDGDFSTSLSLQIMVTNVEEAPTDISLSSNQIDENLPPGTLIGELSLVDPDLRESADGYRIVVLNTATNQISEVNQETGALIPLMTLPFNVGQAHGFDRNPADGKLYLARKQIIRNCMRSIWMPSPKFWQNPSPPILAATI